MNVPKFLVGTIHFINKSMLCHCISTYFWHYASVIVGTLKKNKWIKNKMLGKYRRLIHHSQFWFYWPNLLTCTYCICFLNVIDLQTWLWLFDRSTSSIWIYNPHKGVFWCFRSPKDHREFWLYWLLVAIVMNWSPQVIGNPEAYPLQSSLSVLI